MLRNEVQKKTGLTRKALAYYEEKGLIQPKKSDNGYRDYSEKDLEVLGKVTRLRKLGLTVAEIEEYLSSGGRVLASILRKKQAQLEIEEKRKEVLELVLKGEKQDQIDEKIARIECEESIYEKLERTFPGYFGQMLFAAYRPFLNESLTIEGEKAYKQYVDYLDALPVFALSKEEEAYLNELSLKFDMETLEKVNEAKIDAIYNSDRWLKENKEFLEEYKSYKNGQDYQNSLLKKIEEKLKNYMLENKYYEVAIPLIRKFSKSYDAYYKKLLEANKKYMEANK